MKNDNNYMNGSQAVETIHKAINKLADTVTQTMGPDGKTIVIPDPTEYGKFIITKDGVSVAKVFRTEDRFENVVINLAKQVAEETVKEAGDGTTTSLLLLQQFMKHLHVKDFKLYDDIMERVFENLHESKRTIDEKDIYKVCMVSANGDSNIARTISSAFTNRNADVSVKLGYSTQDTLEREVGYYIPEGLTEAYRSTFKNGLTLNKPLSVLVVNFKIDLETLTKIDKFLLHLRSNNAEGIIIAPDMSQSAKTIIDKNNLSLVVIKAPGFAEHRENLLSDIAAYCGSTVYTAFDKSISKEHLGSVSSAKITSKYSMLVSDKLSNEYLDSLKQNMDNMEPYTKELLEQRLNRLNGFISTIYVGGHSEAEQKERFDRYEDAVLAVRCALDEGVIRGGGVALHNNAYRLTYKATDGTVVTNHIDRLSYSRYDIPKAVIAKVLSEPYNRLSKNGTKYTAMTLDNDIVDPYKVTRTALQKAYNFAKLMLTTESIIVNRYEE